MRQYVGISIDRIRLSDIDDNGFLGYQIDAYGEQESGVPEFEALHPYGFASRALDPEVDGNGDVIFGCLSLTIWEGSEAYSLALHDARKVPTLSTLQKGESLQYGPAGNFLRCHLDGRVTRFATQDGTTDGQSVYDQIGPEGYLAKTPWSVLRNDATGLHFEHVSGAHFDIGSIGGLPAPFSAFTTWAELQAHTVRVKASAIQLGAGSGALPVARATPVASALTAISTALGALQTSLAALGNNGASAPVAAAVAAIATALTTIPSTSTTAT